MRTIFAVFLVLAGLATATQSAFTSVLPDNSALAGQPADSDDDDGPVMETVLDFDFFHQQIQFVFSAPEQALDKSAVAPASTADVENPAKIFSRPFLIPACALLAQIGLPPRAPAAA